jgi:hypothetical protein
MKSGGVTNQEIASKLSSPLGIIEQALRRIRSILTPFVADLK